MSEQIQRWDMNHVQGEVYIDKKPEGSWVTYADHVEALRQAEQRGRETIDVSQVGKPGGSGNAAWDKGYEAGRRDERAELRDPGTAATRGAYEQGQRDMLAKCIAAVEASPAWTDIPFESPDNWREGQPKDYLGYKQVIAALRALQTP